MRIFSVLVRTYMYYRWDRQTDRRTDRHQTDALPAQWVRNWYSRFTIHCKNVRISTNILWRVFHILTEPVLYTFVSVNQRNIEAWAHIAMWTHASLFLNHASLKLTQCRYRRAAFTSTWLFPKCDWFFQFVIENPQLEVVPTTLRQVLIVTVLSSGLLFLHVACQVWFIQFSLSLSAVMLNFDL